MPMYAYQFLDEAGELDQRDGGRPQGLRPTPDRDRRAPCAPCDPGNPRFGWWLRSSLDKFWDSGDPNDIPGALGGAK